MTTKTTKAATIKLPKRNEVEAFEDHAADALESWLKTNAPDIFELWTAHLDLVMYRNSPEQDAPEYEAVLAQEAARSIATVLRIAGPLPEPRPADLLYMQLVSTWKRMTDAEKSGIVAIVTNQARQPVPVLAA